MSGHFADDLTAAITDKHAPVCVGLDPSYDRLPVSIREKFGDDRVGRLVDMTEEVLPRDGGGRREGVERVASKGADNTLADLDQIDGRDALTGNRGGRRATFKRSPDGVGMELVGVLGFQACTRKAPFGILEGGIRGPSGGQGGQHAGDAFVDGIAFQPARAAGGGQGVGVVGLDVLVCGAADGERLVGPGAPREVMRFNAADRQQGGRLGQPGMTAPDAGDVDQSLRLRIVPRDGCDIDVRAQAALKLGAGVRAEPVRSGRHEQADVRGGNVPQEFSQHGWRIGMSLRVIDQDGQSRRLAQQVQRVLHC